MLKLIVQVAVHVFFTTGLLVHLDKTAGRELQFRTVLKYFLLFFIIHFVVYASFLYVSNLGQYYEHLNYFDYLNDYHITTLGAFIKHSLLNTVLSVGMSAVAFGISNKPTIRLSPPIRTESQKRKHQLILTFVLILLCMLFLSVFRYLSTHYPGLPFSQLIFHAFTNKEGASGEIMREIIIQCAVLPLLFSFCLFGLILFACRYSVILLNEKGFVFSLKQINVLLLLLAVVFFYYLGDKVALFKYIEGMYKKSSVYEEYYIDPSAVDFVFPENKRNLIYVFVESLEIGDYSTECGGAFLDNYIPELYELAEENITFNDNKGYDVLDGCSWTIAAMIGQSAGVPLSTQGISGDIINKYSYMPGVYALGEILEKEGYKNELMFGSDKAFAGRDFYFENHGYVIKDLFWLRDHSYTSTETGNSWGAFDYQLYEAAKDELTDLNSSGQPFSLTLLTVDTHFPGGLVCPLCREEFDSQYANVYACASRQLDQFIKWIKEQDFYENTTIVIAGDHHTMDLDFAEIIEKQNVSKKGYYVIINPDESCIPSKNRILTSIDLYPTTVASLGIKWNENRLGLGTNLFSEEETLAEKYGSSQFNEMLNQYSDFYNDRIMLGQES